MEFKELKLHPDLHRGIDEAGYRVCMPVQEQVLGKAFGGQDMYVQSQTGTGKTAAFLIVIFQRLLAEENLHGKKALIMAPTRELAVQIEDEAKMLGKYLPFKTGSFYGGVGYTQQYQLLRDNVQILVGTPGRVLDLNKSGRMNLMEIAFLVLDEADRMFDMGFYPDLRKLIKVVPQADRRQTMLFSATLNARVKNLAWEYTRTPVEIEIEPETVTVDEVTQVLYHVPSNEKMRLLLGILEREQPASAIIFCNTKRHTEIVAKRLRVNGHSCEFIIGDLPQVKRLKVIDDVKSGKIKLLVATDVAARGLDIDNLAMVVNYDLPVEEENYVHRIGRTARAGKTGRAITLASEKDVYELPAIERYIGKKIPSEIAGNDLQTDDKSAKMDIRTDFYEDRREDRGGARGRKTRTGGEGGKSREGRGGRQGDTRKVTGRREKLRANDGDSGRGVTQTAAKFEQPSGSGDLSRLSMEERLAMYRRKYAGKQGEKAEGRQGETKHKGKEHTNRRRQKARQGEQSGGGRKGGGEAVQTTAAQARPEKKGFISKLLGLFGKK